MIWRDFSNDHPPEGTDSIDILCRLKETGNFIRIINLSESPKGWGAYFPSAEKVVFLDAETEHRSGIIYWMPSPEMPS